MSGAKADGRFGKQDFIYQPETDTYRCPAGEQLIWRYTTVENGLTLSRYWSSNCGVCAMKAMCTPSKQRRITRWEHEAVIEAMQRRLDEMPNAMRVRRTSSSTSSARSRTGWAGPLPNTKAGQSRNRDEPPHPRLQPETGSRCPWHPRVDRGDAGMRRDQASP